MGKGDLNVFKNKLRNLTVGEGGGCSGKNLHPGRKDVAHYFVING